jgi:uncharacterized protein with PQ loop repeat
MSKYVKFLISCSNSSLKFLAFIFCFLHLFLAYTYIYSYLTSVWGLAGPCLILFSYERNRILSQLPLALYNIIVLVQPLLHLEGFVLTVINIFH